MRREWQIGLAAAVVFVVICTVIVIYAPDWSIPAVDGGTSAVLPEEPIDINTASAEQLMQLPGVEAELAEAVVAWRTENGPCLSVNELREVDGFSYALLESIRPYVTLTP